MITLILDSFKIGYYIDFSNCLSPTEGIFPVTHAVHTILQVKVTGCTFILIFVSFQNISYLVISGFNTNLISEHITEYFWGLKSFACIVNSSFATWSCLAIKFMSFKHGFEKKDNKKCSPVVEVAWPFCLVEVTYRFFRLKWVFWLKTIPLFMYVGLATQVQFHLSNLSFLCG